MVLKCSQGVASTLPGVAYKGNINQDGLAEQLFNQLVRECFPDRHTALALERFSVLRESHSLSACLGSWGPPEYNLSARMNNSNFQLEEPLCLYGTFLCQKCVMIMTLGGGDTPGFSIARKDNNPLNILEVKRIHKGLNPEMDTKGFNFTSDFDLMTLNFVCANPEDHKPWSEAFTDTFKMNDYSSSYSYEPINCEATFIGREDCAKPFDSIRKKLGEADFLELLRSFSERMLGPQIQICEALGLVFDWAEFLVSTPFLMDREVEVMEQCIYEPVKG